MPRGPFRKALLTTALLLATSCTTVSETGVAPVAATRSFDILIDNGLIIDGSGGEPYVGDVAMIASSRLRRK